MPIFSYEALNEANQPMTGQIRAENVADAVNQLEAQGLEITAIQQVQQETLEADRPAVPESNSSDDQLILQQRIEEVLAKRDILAPALAAFAEELPRGRSQREMRLLAKQMQSGVSAKELNSSGSQIAAMLPLVGGGVGSHRFLSDLFVEATQENATRSQWIRALMYPLFVFCIAIGVLVILCIAIVPAFKSIFMDFGLQLPALTRGIVWLSDIILFIPLLSILLIPAATICIYFLFRFATSWGLPGRTGYL